MEPKRLIEMIDEELNIQSDRNFDVEKLVNSYEMDDRYKPIVKEYVTDVKNLFKQIEKRLDTNPYDPFNKIRGLGMGISVFLGAAIGGLIGGLAEGAERISDGTAFGLMAGLCAELMFGPSTYVVKRLCIRDEYKFFEKSVKVYRNKTLSKLEAL